MTRLLGGRSIRILIGLLALIEAIFLAESFTSMMESVVRNGGSALDLGLLLLLKSPEVVDFALPLVLLLGLFFAISASRDANELIVCAAAGVPWTRIPVFAFVIGLAGFFTSILFAGYLTPTANYTQRMAIYALESHRIVEEITAPSPKNSLRELKDRTVIATPPTTPVAERGNLFVFEADTGEGWRVSQADDWTVEGPDEGDAYSIRLRGFRDYTGVSNVDGETQTSSAQFDQMQARINTARLRVKSLAMEFRLEQIIESADRLPRPNEQVLLDLDDIGAQSEGGKARQVIDRRFAEILGRALLCPFAALMAVAAVAWGGTPSGRFVALPLSAIAVLAGDIIARTVLADAASVGAESFWITFIMLLLIGLSLPLIYIYRRGEAMIASGRGRA